MGRVGNESARLRNIHQIILIMLENCQGDDFTQRKIDDQYKVLTL